MMTGHTVFEFWRKNNIKFENKSQINIYTVWDPKFKTFLNRYGYMLKNNNNNNNNNNMWTRRLAVTCSQEKKDNNFFNSVKWIIVNVTKVQRTPLVLDQLSEEGFDLWPFVTSYWEIPPFLKRKFSWIQNSGQVIWWRDYKTKNEGPFDEITLTIKYISTRL